MKCIVLYSFSAFLLILLVSGLVLAVKFKSPVIYVCENLEKRISVHYWKGQILQECWGRAMNDELCVSFLFVSNILSVFFSMIAEMNQVSHKMVACRCDWQNKLYILLLERGFQGTMNEECFYIWKECGSECLGELRISTKLSVLYFEWNT